MRTIDADELAHTVTSKGTAAWHAVADAFGQDILRADGELDRQKLGAIVFEDPAQLTRLEAIVHPAVTSELASLLSASREPIIVVEAVKLIEAGLHRYCDALWIVTTPSGESKRRLMHDRGIGELDAQLRLRAQPPLKHKLRLATVVIDNSGSFEKTRSQVAAAFASIHPDSGADKSQLLSDLSRAEPGHPAQRMATHAEGHGSE